MMRTEPEYPLADRPLKTMPVLTVELRGKWYLLWVLYPDGSSAPLCFEDLPFPPDDQSQFVDHVPNPVAAEMHCQQSGIELGWMAHELIAGRWALEVKELFQLPE